MPEIIQKFISGFENSFGKHLGDLIPVDKLPGKRDPMHTRYFTVFPGEQKYSDWDLVCRVNGETVTMHVLADMHTYIHQFPELSHGGDFVGNGWFQVMAFMPESDFAPFFDIHLEGIPDSLQEEYLNSYLNPEKSRQETNEWLVLIWLRKLRNGDPEADHMISNTGWLHWALQREQLQEIRTDPAEFVQSYFADRGYDAVLHFLRE